MTMTISMTETIQNDPISRIVANNLCTGCGLCAGAFPQAIRMVEDPVNGRRPVVAPGRASHAAAEKAAGLCAGAGADFTALPRKDAVDAEWGPVLATWEGWAADDAIRHKGSSGGAVTALALFALSRGDVAGVAHVAARADDPRRNAAVLSTDREGLMRGAGSRYAQASPGEILPAVMAAEGPVAFVGKPCDVAGMARLRAQDADMARKLPILIGIFCAGAPNLLATDRLLTRLGVPEGAAVTDLRYRGEGWPGLMAAKFVDDAGKAGETDGISYAQGWGEVLQSERRWRCRICADHTGAFADISVGDPWHNPPKGDTVPGRSLIIARTEAGRALIEAAIAAGAIVAEPRGRDVIGKAQPNLRQAHGAAWGRRLAMRIALMPVPQDKGAGLFALWRGLTVKEQVQSVAGALKRIWRARLWRPVVVRGM
jgi:coenzyme F420 hydrogenase subunit beta